MLFIKVNRRPFCGFRRDRAGRFRLSLLQILSKCAIRAATKQTPPNLSGKKDPPTCANMPGGAEPDRPARKKYQPWMMASVGQTAAHEPQSVHLAGSIQRRLFFSLMAWTGHSDSQAPQLTQASVTLYATVNLLKTLMRTIVPYEWIRCNIRIRLVPPGRGQRRRHSCPPRRGSSILITE